ncbi:S8 family serine peptidase [Microbulbifer thermotolerans]|uniref:S8 family serine peptidase n=1 Tax=Microbulbifer thermotolerans TaxID=252514 RepID=UPI002249411A|nr:S8 family serine peptidase [Microbulbifer thermotolerans]MCX2793987.1 S8 family serine peptidase [Microbulbifer thermotolerans]
MKIIRSSLLLAGILLSFGSMAETDPKTLKPDIRRDHKVYIVQLADKPLVAYEGHIPGLAATKPNANAKLNPQSSQYRHYADFLRARRDTVLASVPGARKVHEYQVAFNGFAALMSSKDAEALRARKDVLGVWEDKLLKPQTDSTRDFLGLTGFFGPWLWGVTGEDIVIGVIDSGVHPEHPSLADTHTPRRGNRGRAVPYGPVPDHFVGEGCDFGNSEFNPADAPFECNRKLIKAESFSDAFLTVNTLADYEFLSARDAGGHGTHTATTAGGNYGVEGPTGGILSGMAPRARIAVYKVCWDAPNPDDSGCFSSDSMAAIDQAVADGVDVINFSVGGSSTTFNGPDDIAFLYAADAGVFVSVSAGNRGPDSETVGTPSGVPWVTAVAAMEDDQSFGTGLRLDAPADIAATYEGLEGGGPVSLADVGAISANVVTTEPQDACGPLTNSDAIDGQIALVIRGGCAFTDKYNNAAAAGARAIVVYNDGTGPDRMDPIVMSAPDTTIPGIMIRHSDGALIAASSDSAGTLSPEIQVSRVDRIAGFSSRGANGGAPDIIKPDVAAPGVGIIAGTSPVSSGGNLFAAMNGTSMASPHVAGVMALLKQVHPDWTPAMAKSALMTTARSGLRKSFGSEAADPFDIGSGAISPSDAFTPGLVYDAGLPDYFAFLCGAEKQPQLVDGTTCSELEDLGYSTDSSDLNLASIGVAELAGSQTITRRVTSVAPGRQWYWVSVDAPEGVNVHVQPRVLRLKRGESATYRVTFTATDAASLGEWTFGSLTWHSLGNRYQVRSPIALRPVPITAPESVIGNGSEGSLSFDVQFGYSGNYQVQISGLAEGIAYPGAVEDGDNDLIFFEIPEGTELSRIALFDADVGAGDGSDDLDLQVYGPAPDFPLVGSSGTPTSAETVTLRNPEPGQYAAFVVDYASAAGPTPYTLFNFNLKGDAGNALLSAPTAADVGRRSSVSLDWMGLAPGGRALGLLRHGDGEQTFAETEVMINTQ